MANVLLVYASMTGNTEDMADAIAQGIREAGGTLKVQMVMDAAAADLAAYDGIVLGAYTWGDGELPDEFLDYYAQMTGLQLQGTKSAVFGSCDSSYSAYGVAVDILMDKLKELGSEVVLEGLKIEFGPSPAEKEICKQFGRQFVRALAEVGGSV
ncbi:flavodoxin [Paenibacillus sp. CF384]|uniref:flavodoxin n=1 Tax=Paenibacillus sp. CF384 TaxID=1884382 RepID=UPI000899DEEF|nr:flavodoxin [Paenibacillus sp. CF384]SDX57579.1 flavodoxin I [Paenibacillus sp. CF384]